MAAPIKARFAPSPTGYLHIGSARTALFNWLFARHMGGQFYLRIEDTDKERSKVEFLEEIIDSLKWLGLDWDGELTFQSKRTDYYRSMADKLVAKDLAYPDAGAIRFRVPKSGKVGFEDMLHGKIEFDLEQHGSLAEDLVIFKSDGSPTYNFAVVCDDAEMGITHVIRGDDHIMNTPKQVPLYAAFGFQQPIFCHIPLILGTDRSRLSKRHGATSITEYRKAGFLSEAIVNYLALLGWSPGNNQELIDRKELIQKFDLGRVLTTGAVFDVEKLAWMNGQYARKMTVPALTDQLMPYLNERGFKGERAWIERIVALYQERIFKLAEFPDSSSFFFEDRVEYNDAAIQEFQKDPRLEKAFVAYADMLNTIEPWDVKVIEEKSRQLMKDLGLSGKEFIHPSRVALTGRTVSPGFFDTVALIGKKRAIERLKAASSVFSKK